MPGEYLWRQVIENEESDMQWWFAVMLLPMIVRERRRKTCLSFSPTVLAAMGMDPNSYPLTAFFGALGLWGANLWLCVDELRQIAEKQGKQRRESVTPAHGQPAQPPPQFPQADPAAPQGGPPVVT